MEWLRNEQIKRENEDAVKRPRFLFLFVHFEAIP